MIRRNIVLIVMACAVCFSACYKPAPDQNKPNIIFILADDLSYRDLSCYGQEQYKTPNLDRLAEVGVRFTQGYTAAPECAPSRGCLLTGLHTGHGSIRINGSARGQEPLKDEDITIAEVLKEAGYATCFVGKWGIGQPGSAGVPYKQGFDVAFGYYSQLRAHTYYPNHLWLNDKKIEYPQNAGFNMAHRYAISRIDPATNPNLNKYDENGDIIIEELADPKGGVFSETEIENTAMDFIRENSEQPFFLYFATQIPHGPVIIDNFGEMQLKAGIPQPNREWAAMVLRLDSFVGELVEELKDLGIYDNTIIFFASDNGYAHCGYFYGRGNAPHWPDDPWFKNKGPFTGGKFSALEGGCRVPFFVSWEGKIKPGVVSDPVWLPDFFPTAAGLAGAEFSHEVDGTDLWPVLGGDPEDFQPHHLYFSKNREQAVRMGAWKAFRESPEHPIRLYLVEEDTYGERDLSSFYPEVLKSIEIIMDTSYTPHEWYWTPDETREEYQKKIDKARETGNILPRLRPNSIE